MYDVIVVGGGPAGMTAALYALRNGKSALVIEKNGFRRSDYSFAEG
jgi:thioredoxin reductase (NADPH)